MTLAIGPKPAQKHRIPPIWSDLRLNPDFSSYPRFPANLPAAFESGRYRVKWASTPEDLDSVLRLRYEVFNLEMREGLESSHASQRDVDEFDPFCHHLMIVEKETGETIGTYRMQTREMARAGRGFYSQSEFDLTTLPEAVLNESMELGRACIQQGHRNGRVLFLLWKGLARYIHHTGKKSFFGCCSLTSQNPEDGLVMHDLLREKGLLHTELEVPVQPAYRCELQPGSMRVFPKVEIPKLMGIYLAYKGKIISQAAIDRQFKTIDFLLLLDIRDMGEKDFVGFLE
jgi:putative hemolysin